MGKDRSQIDNDENLLKKNRISEINTIEKGRSLFNGKGIKKPIIILSLLLVITVVAIVIIVKFYYQKPQIFTPTKNENHAPIEKIDKKITFKSENKHIKLGIESYSKGYFNDAIQEFNEIVESDAEDKDKATALTYLGMINDGRKDYNKAIDYYTRALVYNRNHPDIYKNLALSYRHKNDYTNAVGSIKKSISLNTNDINSIMLLGNLYFETGRYKDSIKQYQRALELSPEKPSLLFNLAASLMKTGDEFAAIEYLKKAGASDRIGDVAHRAYSRLGVLYTERNDYNTAEKYLKQAVSIRPNDPINRYNLGIAYLKQNKKNEALEMLSSAQKYSEENMAMQESLGEAFFSLKDYNRSLNLYNKLLAKNKRNVKILSRVAEIYYKQGDLDKAYSAYKKITIMEPATENARIAYLNMGNIMDDAQRFDEAVRAYKKALIISPKDTSTFYNLGIAYKHSEKPELAVKAWKEASRLNPDDPKSLLALADFYYEKKFYDLAEKQYQNILSKWPNIQDAHFKIATIYYKRNKLDYAMDAYKRVVKINENNAYAAKSLINIAMLNSKLNSDEKSLKESIRQIQKALLIIPGNASAFLSLGIIYSKKEMYDRAIDTFYQGIKNSNDNEIIAELYNNIGKNYYKKNLFKKSLKAFSRAIGEDPSNEQARLNRKAAMQSYEKELAKER